MKIEINGTDCTSIDRFDVVINGESMDSGEQATGIVSAVLDYAFDPKKEIILKSKNETVYILPSSLNIRNYKTEIAKEDIYPWIESSEQEEKTWLGPIVGYFGFRVPANKAKTFVDRGMDYDPAGYDITVTIGSRVDGMPKEKTPLFLLRLLKETMPDFYIDGSSKVPTSYEKIWEILLVQQFRNKLMELRKLGFYRSYIWRRENNDRPKGSIDIARHIRFNGGQKNGRIAYSYREMSFDNQLNRFILKAYDLLKAHYPEQLLRVVNRDSNFKRTIDELHLLCESAISVSDAKVFSENLRPISSPYYFPYEEMRKLCIKIFRRYGSSFLLKEENKSADGFLLYLPDFYELYIANLLRTVFSTKEFDLKEQVKIKRPDGKSSVRPDYVLYKKSSDIPILVLDAKCKPEPSNNDRKKLLRDIAAILTDDFESFTEYRKLGLNAGVLVHPKRIDKDGQNDFVSDKLIDQNTANEWRTENMMDWVGNMLSVQDYLSAYRKERRAKLESFFDPLSKDIRFLTTPIIEEGADYGEWIEKQTEYEKEWADMVRKKLVVQPAQ